MSYMIRMSAFNRTVHCPGSVLLEAAQPDVETEEAAEGTAAHWAAERILTSGTVLLRDDLIGQVAPNGIVIDDAMYDGAKMYYTAIHNMTAHLPIRPRLLVEKLLPAPRVHQLAGGTVDAAAYFPETNELFVWDFKYGHVVVDPEENYQAIGYYAALLDHFKIDGARDQTLLVNITIVQPRAFHRDGCVRTWQVNGGDLRAHINLMANAANKVVQPNAPTAAGDHCLHCRAANSCETLQRAAYKAVSYAGRSEVADMPLDQSAHELDTLRHAEKLITARRKAREAYLEGAIQNGQHVQGYAVERYKSGKRKFTVGNDQIEALGTMCGVNLFKRTPLTPNQAANEGVPEYLINEISEPVASSPKLVKVSQTVAYKAFNRGK